MSYSINNIEQHPSEAIPPISKISPKPRIKKDKESFQDVLDISLSKEELKEKVAMLKISERDDDIEDFEVIEDLEPDYSELEAEDDNSSTSGKRQEGYKFDEAFERRDAIMPEIDDLALFAYIPEDALLLGYNIDSFVDSIGEDDSLEKIRQQAANSLGLKPIDNIAKDKIIEGINTMYGDNKASEKNKLIAQVDALNELEAASILQYLDGKTRPVTREREKEKQRKLVEMENLEEFKDGINE